MIHHFLFVCFIQQTRVSPHNLLNLLHYQQKIPWVEAACCPKLQTFPHFLNSSFCLTTQVSTIATSDGYGKNLADAFETAARLQGIRIHASARLPAMATSGDIDSKVQMVRDFFHFDQNGLLTLAFEGWSLKAYTEMAFKACVSKF